MSLHFNANQFEEAYRPWRLGAWEVARSFPERPRIRKGRTRIIANDRGHLLKASVKSAVSPWGPLTQQLDLNEEKDTRKLKSAKSSFLKENQNHKKEKENTSDDENEKGNEETKNHLKVEGARLCPSPLQSSKVESECSSSPSGTVTPASFRRVSKAGTPSIRSPVMPSRSGSLLTVSNSRDPYEKYHSLKKAASDEDTKNRLIDEASRLPPDSIEDALLPRKPEDVLDGSSRAIAIRYVEHPGATNCTKYTVLRPYTAPNPAAETPLLVKRPKTSKPIREISEIEYALKWDLKDIMEENETIIDLKSDTKRGKTKEPQTPRSVVSNNSEDSGIGIPKRAWEECSADTMELKAKLESLKKNQDTSHSNNENKRYCEPESGYGTPASTTAKSSLPSVTPDNHSITGSNPAMKLNIPRSVSNLSLKSNSKKSEKISIDSKCLSAKASNNHSRQSSSISKLPSNNSLSADNGSKAKNVSRDIKTPEAPPERNPLEIMETLDSVFHKVPLRDTTGKYEYNYERAKEEKERVAKATQTEMKTRTTDQSTTTHKEKLRKQEMRARNCVACEVRASDDPPRKHYRGTDGRQPFRFGKPEKKYLNRPRYIKQSERYQAKLRTHQDGPRFWPINTLSSPFNNRQGYGQDQYPNHMRLRTTYQMAHQKNDKPHHTPLMRKLYK